MEAKKKELFVVAGAIISNKKVFAAQRGASGKTAFKWEFPGGKINPGETPEQALARELMEELSINVEVNELIYKVVDEYEDVILHIDTYKCKLISGAPTLSEHINMGWFDQNELDNVKFSPADDPVLAKIKKLYL